ncbi:MAG: ROK family protein [Rhodothermales bacterium]|nr:ROK family protein [Rhodothermales bacterium]MBO6779835.1 ROK family protein [Rhodothermales bacterium]
MGQYAVGIDLGGTSIKSALVSRDKGVVASDSYPTEAEAGPDRVLDNITTLVRRMMTASPEPVLGIGMGSPGIIDWERTSVSHPPNLPGWKTVHLGEAISNRLGQHCDCIVENDANVAGLGSAHYGAGKPFDSFIMVTLGTGVGGAIIYENRIFRGATGGAGEIGHMTIDFEGPKDNHDIPGASEAYLGQRFLSAHACRMLADRSDSVLHERVLRDPDGIAPKDLHDAAVDGDEAAAEVLRWAGHKLGVLLGSAVNLLDIRKLVVGGGLSAAGDFIFASARTTIEQFVTHGLRAGIEIIQEPRGNEVGVLGAAHLVFQEADYRGSE